METIIAIVNVTVGLLIRLALPLGLTGILIFFLRKLDARWQAEAPAATLDIQGVECWKIKKCPPEQVINCVAANAALPCWQVFRLPNGYLREACLSCEVFTKAPLPTLKAEPRRM